MPNKQYWSFDFVLPKHIKNKLIEVEATNAEEAKESILKVLYGLNKQSVKVYKLTKQKRKELKKWLLSKENIIKNNY